MEIHIERSSSGTQGVVNGAVDCIENISSIDSYNNEEKPDLTLPSGSTETTASSTSSNSSSSRSVTKSRNKKPTNKKLKKRHGQKKELTAKQVSENRKIMAVAYFVCSVPRYSLSIFAYLAFRNVPLGDLEGTFHRPWERARVSVDNEGESYEQCVADRFPALIEDVRNAAKAEQLRSEDIAGRNSEVVARAMSSGGQCQVTTELARKSLFAWKRVGNELPISGTCSASDRAFLLEVLGNDIVLVSESVTSPLDSFAESGKASLTAMAEYSQERVLYDADYFVGRRIKPAIEILEKLVDELPPGFKHELSVKFLKENLRALLKQVEHILMNATRYGKELKQMVDELIVKLKMTARQYQDLYFRISEFIDKVGEHVPDFVIGAFDIDAALNLDGLPLPSQILPANFTYPEPPSLPNPTESIEEAVRSIVEFMLDVASSIEADSNLRISVYKDVNVDLSRLIDLLTLEDYDPPQYVGSHSHITSVEEEHGYYVQQSGKARGEVLEAIGGISDFVNLDVDNVTPSLPDINATDVGTEDSSILSFEYLSVRWPHLWLPKFIMSIVMFLLGHSWVVEACFHVLRTSRVAYLYLRSGKPCLPTIDYSITENGDAVETPQTPSIFSQMFTELAASFSTARMVTLAVVLPGCILALKYWEPYLDETCGMHGNGTSFATGVLIPFVVNEANVDGNYLYGRNVADCEKFERSFCNALHGDSDRRYRADVATLHAARDMHSQVLSRRRVMTSCVDNEEVVAGLQNSCCGLPGYDDENGFDCDELDPFEDIACPIMDNSTSPVTPYLPLYEYLEDAPGCDELALLEDAVDVLEDSRFNCEALSGICTSYLGCSPVDRESVRDQIVQSDCAIQTAAVRCCLFCVILVVHAMCLNLILTTFFGGCRRLHWRSVSPGGISFKSRVSESNGKLFGGFYYADRMNYIGRATRSYELAGKLMVVVSFLMLVGWLAFLCAVRF